MARILTPILARPILTLADFPEASEPEESGTTYEANAVLKARSGAAATGEACLADDGGLEVDALRGAPGLYSKRFGGEDLPFPEKIARLLSLLRGVPDPARSARFRCWVALAVPGEIEVLTFEGLCEGKMAHQPSGDRGFGYDPIFIPNALGHAMAEATDAEKDAISHRGQALKRLAEALLTRERHNWEQ
ncbi:MAG: non-canonical purine NTP pyrophosphatase, RdgB/HAM1 family [Armatimonadota bacterium]